MPNIARSLHNPLTALAEKYLEIAFLTDAVLRHPPQLVALGALAVACEELRVPYETIGLWKSCTGALMTELHEAVLTIV